MKRQRIHLCGDPAMVVTEPDCPNAAQHTPMPAGYSERFEWAEEMLKTHKQTPCAGCDRLNIWVPKEAA